MSYEKAAATLRRTDEQTVAHMCASARIPAPGGEEAERGDWLAARLTELGLAPERDDAGNVVAVSPAADPDAARVVIASHLDTVFARDTPLEVRRDGSRILCPGISDNSRGLAGLVALARALRDADWPTRAPVVFLGSVGEEGAGDLRGVKHYIAREAAGTGCFIALDGAGDTRIITAGVGSRRLRVTMTGPGGHSWSDWGAPNAIHGVARVVAAVTALDVPREPRSTLSVGRIGGGTSINTIPAECWFELDIRSQQRAPLLSLEAEVRAVIERVSAEQHLAVEVAVFGDRPAGSTPEQHPLVQSAFAATRALGLTPELAGSSTDANVPMAAGIPAIAIGGGGQAGGTHTTGEWYDNTDGVRGLERALRIVFDAAG